MDVEAFCRQSRVIIVAGKGGVGKTTTAAALALVAARAGLRVLLVELDGKPELSQLFGSSEPLTYEGVDLVMADGKRGPIRAKQLTPDDALIEYLADHGLKRATKRLVSAGIVEVVATAIPGIKDVLVLGKIRSFEHDQVADLIVVDAPATGHAKTFLTSSAGMVDAARSGPVRNQAQGVVELLTDPARCKVVLVTLPEELPTTELIEAAYFVEDKAGVSLALIVVNAMEEVDPALEVPIDPFAHPGLDAAALERLEAARQFSVDRSSLAQLQRTRLARELPLPQVVLPRLDTKRVDIDGLTVLAEALEAGISTLAANGG